MLLSRRGAPGKFVAWLAIAAIWLLATAPTLSRVMPAAWAWPDLGAWCTGHGLSEHHSPEPGTPLDPTLHLDHCGYCALLGHSPWLAAAAPIVRALAPLSSPPPLAVARHWHAQPVLSAHPRGPPSDLPG